MLNPCLSTHEDSLISTKGLAVKASGYCSEKILLEEMRDHCFRSGRIAIRVNVSSST